MNIPQINGIIKMYEYIRENPDAVFGPTSGGYRTWLSGLDTASALFIPIVDKQNTLMTVITARGWAPAPPNLWDQMMAKDYSEAQIRAELFALQSGTLKKMREIATSEEAIPVDRIAQLTVLIDLLEEARSQPEKFLTPDMPAAQVFLSGFGTTCERLLGVEVADTAYAEAAQARGWQRTDLGIWQEMREKGLSDDQIRDELITLQIAAWQLRKTKLAPPESK